MTKKNWCSCFSKSGQHGFLITFHQKKALRLTCRRKVEVFGPCAAMKASQLSFKKDQFLSPRLLIQAMMISRPAVIAQNAWFLLNSSLVERALGNKTLKNAVNQFWTNRTPLRCEQCSMELYCSEKCKLDSWKKYHRLICPSQNKHAAKLYEICTEFKKASVKSSGKVEGWWYDNFSPIVLAKLWASILCDANSKVESIEEVVSDVLIAISQRKFDR